MQAEGGRFGSSPVPDGIPSNEDCANGGLGVLMASMW
jgi:hypothetical protein